MPGIHVEWRITQTWMPANCCRCPTAHCIKFLIITNSDSYALANRIILFIHPPLSVVIRLQPKGGLPACVRFDQKCGTKNPDLFSQIRINLVEVTGFEPATFWSRNLISQGFWIPVCPFDSFFDRICSDEKVSSIGANCVADNWILTGVDWFESRLNGSVYLLRCFCDPLAGSKTLSTLIQKRPGNLLKTRDFRGVWCLRRHLWGGCYLGGFTIKWYLEYRWKVDASLENAHASEHIPM